MIRILISVLFLGLLATINSTAQHRCVNPTRITLVETHDFSPVYPAVVYVEALNKAFETDESGSMVLDSLCDGSYIIRIQGTGYEEKQTTISLKGRKPVKVKVDYELHALHEVTVKEEQKNSLIQSKDNLGKNALDDNQGKTLAGMLENINGVTTLSNGATIAKPVIHGLHSNRILMLNHGIRQEDQQWGAEHAPNIDPYTADNITVLKGAAGVRYGTDAIGGVVLVEPKPMPAQTGWGGELNLAGFSNNRMGVGSFMLEHAFKKNPALSLRVQGSLKKGGNYRIPGHWVANTGLQESNYSATAAYQKLHYGTEIFYSNFNTSLGIYKGSHTGNQNDLLNAINSPVPLVQSDFSYDLERPKQHIVHHLLKAKIYADSRWGRWDIIYGYQHNFRQEYDVIRQENGKAQLNLTLQTHTLNINLDHKKLFGLSGQTGIDVISQDNRFQNGDRVFIPTYQSRGIAGYLVERYHLKNLMLEAGLRYDYKGYGVYNPQGNNQQIVYYEFNYGNASGTLGLKQQVNAHWDWNLTLANAWRAPQANELFSAGLHHGAARIELGNKDLQPENAYSVSFDNRYAVGDKLYTSVSLYSQLINNYIYLIPGEDLLTIRGYFKTFHFRQTNAWLNGADLTVRYDWNNYLTSTVKASVLRARDRKANDWLILMPADRVSFNTRFSKNLSEKWKNMFAEVTGRYVFRQTRIPGNFDEIDYPRPPRDYFLLDAALGIQQMVGKQPVNISLAATNLFNIRYRDYLDVFRYFLDQPGTNMALRIAIPFEFH
ncbi:MAG TPA: TonB-dependent receptor plug domain-containing protein [Flavipsychrobacter sp.]|nr:TonB-dependent receptor plug domain-containing protein [Flavipsychrobacter sp.]